MSSKKNKAQNVWNKNWKLENLFEQTPPLSSVEHSRLDWKKKKKKKKEKKKRNACCQAIFIQAKKRTREFACLFETFKYVGDKIKYRVLSFSSEGKGNKINPFCR